MGDLVRFCLQYISIEDCLEENFKFRDGEGPIFNEIGGGQKEHKYKCPFPGFNSKLHPGKVPVYLPVVLSEALPDPKTRMHEVLNIRNCQYIQVHESDLVNWNDIYSNYFEAKAHFPHVEDASFGLGKMLYQREIQPQKLIEMMLQNASQPAQRSQREASSSRPGNSKKQTSGKKTAKRPLPETTDELKVKNNDRVEKAEKAREMVDKHKPTNLEKLNPNQPLGGNQKHIHKSYREIRGPSLAQEEADIVRYSKMAPSSIEPRSSLDSYGLNEQHHTRADGTAFVDRQDMRDNSQKRKKKLHRNDEREDSKPVESQPIEPLKLQTQATPPPPIPKVPRSKSSIKPSAAKLDKPVAITPVQDLQSLVSPFSLPPLPQLTLEKSAEKLGKSHKKGSAKDRKLGPSCIESMKQTILDLQEKSQKDSLSKEAKAEPARKQLAIAPVQMQLVKSEATSYIWLQPIPAILEEVKVKLSKWKHTTHHSGDKLLRIWEFFVPIQKVLSKCLMKGYDHEVAPLMQQALALMEFEPYEKAGASKPSNTKEAERGKKDFKVSRVEGEGEVKAEVKAKPVSQVKNRSKSVYKAPEKAKLRESKSPETPTKGGGEKDKSKAKKKKAAAKEMDSFIVTSDPTTAETQDTELGLGKSRIIEELEACKAKSAKKSVRQKKASFTSPEELLESLAAKDWDTPMTKATQGGEIGEGRQKVMVPAKQRAKSRAKSVMKKKATEECSPPQLEALGKRSLAEVLSAEATRGGAKSDWPSAMRSPSGQNTPDGRRGGGMLSGAAPGSGVDGSLDEDKILKRQAAIKKAVVADLQSTFAVLSEEQLEVFGTGFAVALAGLDSRKEINGYLNVKMNQIKHEAAQIRAADCREVQRLVDSVLDELKEELLETRFTKNMARGV